MTDLFTTTTIKAVLDLTFRNPRADDDKTVQPNRGVTALFFSAPLPFIGQQCIRYDIAHDAIMAPPLPVNSTTIQGLDPAWDRIDAAVNWGNGKAYLFCGSQYARYDIPSQRVEYTDATASTWRGLNWDHIDSVLNWGDGQVYFFRGAEYLRYDMALDEVVGWKENPPRYPRIIDNNSWTGLPWPSFDTVLNWGNGKAYFFRGAEFVCYSLANDKVESGPHPLTTLRLGPSSFSLPEFYKSVGEIARSLVGSHYVWGGTGSSPQGIEGSLRRPRSNALVSPPRLLMTDPALFAATSNIDGNNVCGGKWESAGGLISALDSDTQAELNAHMLALQRQPDTEWRPFQDDLSPRMAHDKSWRGGANVLALGEDCRAKRHFDCIGFVNYCIEMAIARVRPIDYSIALWNDPNITGCPVGDPSKYPNNAYVLTRDNNHIALLTADGMVVQASHTGVGVISSPYNPADRWTGRFRLGPSLLGV